jgi:hypothetical protein
MTEGTLRFRLGIGLVVSHVAAIFALIVLTAIDRFTIDEMFNTLGVMVPLFAAYTTAIVRRIVHEVVSEDDNKPVSSGKTVVSGLFPTAFVVFVMGVILWKAFGSLRFESLIKLLALSETLLGVYVGIVVEALFGPGSPKGATTSER